MSNMSPVPFDPAMGSPELAGRQQPGLPPGFGGGGDLPPSGPTTSMLKRAISALLRFKLMILAILALGVGVAFVAVRFQKPVYETRSRIWLQPGLSGGTGGAAGPIRQGALLDAAGWQSLLRSSTVLDTVIIQRRLFLNLAQPQDSLLFEGFRMVPNARFRPGRYVLAAEGAGGFRLSDGEGTVIQRGAFGDSVGTALGFEWVPSASLVPSNRPVEFTIRVPGDVRAELARDLVTVQTMVQGRVDNNFLVVSMRGPDQFKIAATLDAVIRRFETVALDLKKERLTAQTEILNDQLKTAEQALASRETAYEEFKVNTATLPTEERGMGVPLPSGLPQTSQTVFGTFFSLNTQKDQLARDRASIDRALSELGGQFAMVTAMEVIPTVKTSSALTVALKQVVDAEANRRALSVTLTDEHPQVRSAAMSRDSLLQHVIPSLVATLLRDMDRREEELNGQITNLAEEMRQIPMRTIEGDRLARQVDIAATLYRELESRYQASRLTELTTVADLSVVDWPRVPFTPVDDPRRTLFLLIVAAAFGLGLGLAILRDRLDPRVQYPDQVTAGMGLNILGAVPTLRRSGKLGSGDMALVVEAFRSIQLRLTHAASNGGPMTVTFTSPGASDGKSFVASNLAIAFADMGHRTLVIDGDVRRGSMHKLLGADHRPGLTDYLAGRVDRASTIQETRYPLLHFIGCGSRRDSGPKLLGSPAMRSLMQELRDEYDVIIVDSPPLGACVDPMILATLTRNLVLVVRSGTTDRTLAESKLDALDRLPVRVVGAILNDVSRGGPYRYYSYISGYEVIDDDGGLLPSAADGADTEEPSEPEAGEQATSSVAGSENRPPK